MAKLFAFEDETVMDDAVPAAAEVEAEQVVSELTEDASGVEEGVTAIDDGEEAASQLEEVQEVVAATVDGTGEAQGLDPVAAEAIRIAVESICARMGASTKQFYALYATENFESKSSRVANTKIALESIADTLKNVWAKIVAFLKGLVAKVVGFWNKLMYNINGTLKSVKALQKKVKDNEGSTADLTKETRELVMPKSVLSAFGQSEITSEIVTKSLSGFTTLMKTFNDDIAIMSKDSADATSVRVKVISSNGYELFFNKTLETKALAKSFDDETNEANSSISIQVVDSGKTLPDSCKSQVLKKDEMRKVLDACVTTLTAMSDIYKNVNNLSEVMKAKDRDFEKAIAELNTKASDANTEDNIAKQREMMKKFKKNRDAVVSCIKLASPKLQVNGVRGIRASMDYVKASLAKYK